MGKTHFSGPVLYGDTRDGQQQGTVPVVFKPVISAVDTAVLVQTFPEGALIKDIIAFPVAAGAAAAVTVLLGTTPGGVEIFTAAITAHTQVSVRVPAGGSLYAEISVGAAAPYVLYITAVP